jgi:hypothetical protein
VHHACPCRRLSASDSCSLIGCRPCSIRFRSSLETCSHSLSRRLLLSPRMPSRQNINPHPHTFSIARRIRRKRAAASFKGRYRKSAAIQHATLTSTGLRRGFPINAIPFPPVVNCWRNGLLSPGMGKRAATFEDLSCAEVCNSQNASVDAVHAAATGGAREGRPNYSRIFRIASGA